MVLINPKIISKENEVNYYEGCLSFPGRAVSTKRYRDIIISTEQEESKWYFSGAESSKDTKGTWEASSKHDQEQRLLESVCIQHEIDHLNGKTIQDREDKLKPVQSGKSVGRNDKCPCESGKKYKKCCLNKWEEK